ncbi:energy-coupled thiamine transporter ThiT [Gemmiger formicilis]|uniref:energy-coupled thiamine transporter ThiT n=1 Tax=Gemmiger formicilis TaxID=745368 RepID=UPI003993326F
MPSRSSNRLVGVAVGTAAVCGIRFLCSFLSGVLIWGNLSDGLPAWTYSLTYSGSYMLPETILTTVAAVLIYKAAPSCSQSRKSKVTNGLPEACAGKTVI